MENSSNIAQKQLQDSCAIPIHVCFLFFHHCQAAVSGLGQQNSAQVVQGCGVLVYFSAENMCPKKYLREKCPFMSIFAAVREIILTIQRKPDNHLPKLKNYSKYRVKIYSMYTVFFQFWKMPILLEHFNFIFYVFHRPYIYIYNLYQSLTIQKLHEIETGWWLGHPSEKYESRVG